MPCHRTSRQRSGGADGFTLLETLVVLVIISLAATIAAPRLQTLVDSVTFALQRDSFQRELNNLPYQAFKRGADLELGSRIGAQASDAAAERADASSYPGQRLQADLNIPETWRLRVEPPIVYRASGYCPGGSVVVEAGSYAERFVLRPPACLAEAVP